MSPATEGRRPPRYLQVADRIWPALRRVAGLHTFLYRRTGGRLGDRIPGLSGKVLLLDHVGAKSGVRRTTPLYYAADGPDLLLVASKGGFPRNPAWFHNLMANPDTTVQVGSELRPVHARVAKPEERDRLWAKAVQGYHGYEDYRARTDREIPLVVLQPRRGTRPDRGGASCTFSPPTPSDGLQRPSKKLSGTPIGTGSAGAPRKS